MNNSDMIVVFSAGAAIVSGLSAGTALHPRARTPDPLPGLLFYRQHRTAVP
jgi:hypothetical protein